LPAKKKKKKLTSRTGFSTNQFPSVNKKAELPAFSPLGKELQERSQNINKTIPRQLWNILNLKF